MMDLFQRSYIMELQRTIKDRVKIIQPMEARLFQLEQRLSINKHICLVNAYMPTKKVNSDFEY